MLRRFFIQVSLSLIGSLCFQSVHSLGALADIPTFQTQLNFGTSCPLWDPTGNYEFTKDVSEPNLGTTNIVFALSTNEKGQTSGTGSWTGSVMDPDLGLIELNFFDPNVKGKIKSSGPVTHFKLKSSMKAPCGELCAGFGRNKWKLVAKVKFSGEVDGAGTAHGLLKLSLTMKRALR